MNEFKATDLALGVISGLTTSGVIFLGRHWIGFVLSWIFNKIGGSKARLADEWRTTFKKASLEHHETANVCQVGPYVWGKIRFSRTSEKDRIYKFKGKYSDGILVATYEDTGQAIDKGAFTLKAKAQNGEINSLIGYYAWTDDDKNEPSADTYIWQKKKS